VKLSREQLERRKAQAVCFTRDVVGDEDRADEIENETLEAYAERRRIQITNPRRRAMKTRQQLLDEITELTETIEDLEDDRDQILDIVAPEEEGEEEGEEEEPERGEG